MGVNREVKGSCDMKSRRGAWIVSTGISEFDVVMEDQKED